MVQYNGSLGNFSYDNNQFEVKQSEETNPDYSNEYLHYIGNETDGSNVTVPEGLTNADNLFAGSKLQSPATLPQSVTSTVGTYAYCTDLQNGDAFVPDNVTNQSFMYDGCSNLKTPGKISPNAVSLDGMYNDCSSLTYCPSIPDNTKSIESMCANSGIQTPPMGGRNVENAHGAFAFCENMEGYPEELNPNAQMTDMTTGCTKLNEMEIPTPEKQASLAERYAAITPNAFDELNPEVDDLGIENEQQVSLEGDIDTPEADAKTAQRAASADIVKSDDGVEKENSGFGF